MAKALSEREIRKKTTEMGVRLQVIRPHSGMNRYEFYHPSFGRFVLDGAYNATAFLDGLAAGQKMAMQVN